MGSQGRQLHTISFLFIYLFLCIFFCAAVPRLSLHAVQIPAAF